MKIVLSDSEQETLKALVIFGLVARKGNFLHQAHEARDEDLYSLAVKLGLDPNEHEPSGGR